LATATVFFQDTVPMYQVWLMVWMYLTPIFWPVQIVPDEWMMVVQLNPLYHLVQIFRDPIYVGVAPDPVNVVVSLVYAVAAAALGWWRLERSRDDFAAYI
jgi:ABC-type polysaccharide/polyol phosphate export permease